MDIFEVLFNKYDFNQVNISENFIHAHELFKIYKKVNNNKNQHLFVNIVNFNYLAKYKKKFINLNTISILDPWEEPYLPKFFEYDDTLFFNLIIAPKHILCRHSNRELSIVKDTLSIGKFLIEEGVR